MTLHAAGSTRSRRIIFAIVAVGLCIALLLPFLRQGYHAALVLADLAHVQLPLSAKRPEVLRRDIEYRASGRNRAADLYVPEGGAGAGLVLVPGAAPDGRNDARLVEFATLLARSGFVVIVPDIKSLRELEPSADSAGEIVDAFTFLRKEERGVPSGPLGISAFSIAVGPAVLASLDPAINDQVRFLLLVGGYHDLTRTLKFLTTGYFEVDGQSRFREPDTYGKWVYALSNASRLQDPAEQTDLSTLARRKLEDPEAVVEDLRARLGVSGTAVYEFINNTDPAKAGPLMQRLPPAVRADIAALDLAAHDLSKIRAEVILVHGLDDDIIPYTESMSLAAALPHGQANLYVLEGLHHVDRDIKGLDVWRMWRLMLNLLAQQEP